jgi:DNA-directed RNA polymerase subunit RPC12/RpoP|tara:strand:+ start:148 stop:399 length:252 start_codon:yes stop_codon:yes gene_type:complete
MAMEGQQMQVDLDSTIEIVCDECGHNVFQPAYFLRKISRFMSPDGQDRLLPLDTMACAKCGNINKEFQAATPQTKTKTNKDGK